MAKCRKVQWDTQQRYSVFANETLNHVGAEKFRTLRSRLYQIAAAQPIKRILLTSSVPEEGKTFIAANLALSIIRQPERRVLLIDADLRASRLHVVLGAPNDAGLSDYLQSAIEETSVIQVAKEGNFCFIPGGSQVSNPSELLHSDRMKALLDKLTPMFDWIILDSPPAIAVHDASILADMCDGVLFVVKAGQTDFELAESVLRISRQEFAGRGSTASRKMNPTVIIITAIQLSIEKKSRFARMDGTVKNRERKPIFVFCESEFTLE